MRLYAEDMNLNRKDEKKYVEIQTFNFLENKQVKNFFCQSKCFIALRVI